MDEFPPELLDPANRELLREYRVVSMENMDASVFTPLIERYPLLSPIVEEIKVNGDPVKELEYSWDDLDILVGFVWSTGLTLRAVGASFLMADLEPAMRALDTYMNLRTKIEQLQVKEYIDMTNAVKDVAASEGVALHEVVREQKYRDEVARRVYSTRAEADERSHLSRSYMELCMNIVNAFIALVEPENKMSEAAIAVNDNMFDEMRKMMDEFNKGELDRIYSSSAER